MGINFKTPLCTKYGNLNSQKKLMCILYIVIFYTIGIIPVIINRAIINESGNLIPDKFNLYEWQMVKFKIIFSFQ